MEKVSQDKIPIWLIVGISVVVPVLVAFLFIAPSRLFVGDFVYSLPHFHGIINSVTAFVLVAAVISIKNGKQQLHRQLMLTAVGLGFLFLVSYVIYHSSVDPIKFGDSDHDGIVDSVVSSGVRSFYLVLLISHIILSGVVLPLILASLYLGLKGRFDAHRRWVKWAFPIWLYVSISGVIVYWMMRPYYF